MEDNARNWTEPQKDEDIPLISLVLEGDRIAFDRLVRKYQNKVMALCCQLLGERAEAEDAAQDVFVKVYQNIGSFKAQSLFSTWLYRVTVNICRNRSGSWWARVRRKALRLDRQTGDDYSAPIDTGPMPDSELRQKRIRALVMTGLRSLPVSQREMVVLRDIKGMSYDEIKTVSGIPVGTVKSRIARARESLQKILKGVADGP
jgi:RNA polymerase sigma-70 factor (ECF subfamily)